VIGLNRRSPSPGGSRPMRRRRVVPSPRPPATSEQALLRPEQARSWAQANALTLAAVASSERLEALECRFECRVGQAERLCPWASGLLVDRAMVEGARDDPPPHVHLEVVCRGAY
jgi:hypothetical protein